MTFVIGPDLGTECGTCFEECPAGVTPGGRGVSNHEDLHHRAGGGAGGAGRP